MGTKNNNIPGTVIRVDEVNHGNEKRTRLVFGYNAEIIKKVRQIPGARWA